MRQTNLQTPACATEGREDRTVEELRAENVTLREALETIKARVCGDGFPHWQDAWHTTHSRGLIADWCDNALASTPRTAQIAEVVKAALELRREMSPVVATEGILYHVPELIGERFYDAVDALNREEIPSADT